MFLPAEVGDAEEARYPSPSELPTYEFSEDEWHTKSQVRGVLCDTRSGIEDAKQLAELQQLLRGLTLSQPGSEMKGTAARIADQELARLDVRCGANPRLVANEVSFPPDVVLLSYARAGSKQVRSTSVLVRVGAVSFETGQLVLANLWVEPRGPTLREGKVLATNVSRYFTAAPAPCVNVECPHIFDYSTLYGNWELYFGDAGPVGDRGIAIMLPIAGGGTSKAASSLAILRFSAPSGARWQPSRTRQRPSAELLAEGVSASKKSRLALAWGFFAEANRVAPNPQTRLNIARTLGAMGKRDEACQRLEVLRKETAPKTILYAADLSQRVLECGGRRPTFAVLAEVSGDATAGAQLRAGYYQALRARSIEPAAKKDVYARADAIIRDLEEGAAAAYPLLATLRSELGVDLVVWAHQPSADAATLRTVVATTQGVELLESDVSDPGGRAKTDIEKALRVWKKEALQPLD